MMKLADSFPLRDRFKDNPDKEKIFRAVTEVIAEKNSVRILVNSTGAFPEHPSKSGGKIRHR